MWASYLSLFLAGHTFLSFQWDILLLETGLLSAVAQTHLMRSGAGPRVVQLLFRFVFWKLMFMAGVVKIQANCPTWLHLTALEVSYMHCYFLCLRQHSDPFANIYLSLCYILTFLCVACVCSITSPRSRCPVPWPGTRTSCPRCCCAWAWPARCWWRYRSLSCRWPNRLPPADSPWSRRRCCRSASFSRATTHSSTSSPSSSWSPCGNVT